MLNKMWAEARNHFMIYFYGLKAAVNGFDDHWFHLTANGFNQPTDSGCHSFRSIVYRFDSNNHGLQVLHNPGFSLLFSY